MSPAIAIIASTPNVNRLNTTISQHGPKLLPEKHNHLPNMDNLIPLLGPSRTALLLQPQIPTNETPPRELPIRKRQVDIPPRRTHLQPLEHNRERLSGPAAAAPAVRHDHPWLPSPLIEWEVDGALERRGGHPVLLRSDEDEGVQGGDAGGPVARVLVGVARGVGDDLRDAGLVEDGGRLEAAMSAGFKVIERPSGGTRLSRG